MTIKEWTRVMELHGWHYEEDGWWHFRDIGRMGSTLPQPSLDLMHELEGELKGDERIYYSSEICKLLGLFKPEYSNRQLYFWEAFTLVHATAEQKAQAWLKVKES